MISEIIIFFFTIHREQYYFENTFMCLENGMTIAFYLIEGVYFFKGIIEEDNKDLTEICIVFFLNI